MEIIIYVIIAIVALGIGFAVAMAFQRNMARTRAKVIVEEAKNEAEVIKKDKLLEAREQGMRIEAEAEKQAQQKLAKIQSKEGQLKQRELQLNQQQSENQRNRNENEQMRARLDEQMAATEARANELETLKRRAQEELERMSGLSSEEAKERLIESLKDEAKTAAQSYINDIMDEVFQIESDEVKGRIIGREGRNIRALEAATGIEIIVDDTPEAIVLSGFDPVRREIARLALHQLVADGRIHPARIEEVVAKVRKQVEEEIIETGKRTTIDLGIHGLHPELVRLVGKMKYRSSYGQNLLQHSRETANLCAVMASELGLNPKKARRAGLLHDIGKVPDEEPSQAPVPVPDAKWLRPISSVSTTSSNSHCHTPALSRPTPSRPDANSA